MRDATGRIADRTRPIHDIATVRSGHIRPPPRCDVAGMGLGDLCQTVISVQNRFALPFADAVYGLAHALLAGQIAAASQGKRILLRGSSPAAGTQNQK